jgi:hypothetical protein
MSFLSLATCFYFSLSLSLSTFSSRLFFCRIVHHYSRSIDNERNIERRDFSRHFCCCSLIEGTSCHRSLSTASLNTWFWFLMKKTFHEQFIANCCYVHFLSFNKARASFTLSHETLKPNAFWISLSYSIEIIWDTSYFSIQMAHHDTIIESCTSHLFVVYFNDHGCTWLTCTYVQESYLCFIQLLSIHCWIYTFL